MSKRDPYPLQWPEGWKRTAYRSVPKFVARFAIDRDAVIRRLKRRRGSHITITSDLPTRNDGLPYANASCQDPGIAVYWIERGKEHVIACDKWRTVSQNLRAVEMSLEAMAGLDRWGAAEMVDKAFAGFASLPAGSGEEINVAPPKRTWREILGATFGPWPGELVSDELLDLAKRRHRKLIQLHHPDTGGSHDRAAELNAALAEAERELGAPS